MDKELKHISKLMSLVLRHKPEDIDLHLDENGWADVEELINKINAKNYQLTSDLLDFIVDHNDKKRFSLNINKTKIRANQGHSLPVELNLAEVTPPNILYHGTAKKYLDSILAKGLQKQKRQHVHLSTNIETALSVGSRHGKPIILIIDTISMLKDGFSFYLSENNVWLTHNVPSQYIKQWKEN
ncbi:MAG: RNA 2'-phosphotransferase [Chitinophagaceae bacterium]